LGSYGIDLRTNFPTFAGWIIPPEKKIFLIASNYQEVQEAVIWLRRVGLDNIIGFLEGGMNAWVESGFRTNHIGQVSSSEFNEIRSKKKINIIDVRMPSEYKTNHLKGAINIPFPDLRQEYTKLKEDDEYFLICSSGRRSILGISILEKKGFKKLINVSGGMTGLNNLGVKR
jgi:rhodanese-related sulfurtransferase